MLKRLIIRKRRLDLSSLLFPFDFFLSYAIASLEMSVSISSVEFASHKSKGHYFI